MRTFLVHLAFFVLSLESAMTFAVGGSDSCVSTAPIQDRALIDELDEVFRRGKQNTERGGKNFEGHAWKTLIDDGDGVVVETSRSSSSKFNLFRSTMVLRCDGNADDQLRAIVAPLFDVERRGEWDPQIALGRTLASDRTAGSDVSLKVIRYGTAAALGGVIKSRLFTDIAATKQMKGEVLCASVAWDVFKHKSALGLADSDLALEKKEKGLIVGTNMKGGCVRVTSLGGARYRVTFVGFTDIGGWLPAKVVNSASADSFRNMSGWLAKRLGAAIVAGPPASSLAP